MKFLAGRWKGETNTWFDPTAKPELGTISTEFKPILDGLFIEEVYTGTVGAKAHEGRRIFGTDKRLNEATCYWMDTFHTGATAMLCRGPASDSSANLFSLVITARANGIEPYDYLKKVFSELPKADSIEDLERLMPVRFLESQSSAQVDN